MSDTKYKNLVYKGLVQKIQKSRLPEITPKRHVIKHQMIDEKEGIWGRLPDLIEIEAYN